MKLKRFLMTGLLLVMVVPAGMYLLRFHTTKAVFPVRGEYIHLEDGANLYTVARGKGRPVIFLHGFPYHSESFFEVASQPPEGFQFITVDFPGAGLSGKTFEQKPTPETLALLLKMLCDRMDVESVDLVGHDLGGGVAIVFAALFPHLVERVVLIAPDSSVGTSANIMNPLWRVPVLGEWWASLRLDRQFIRDILARSWVLNEPSWRQAVERYARVLDTKNGRQGFMALHRGRLDCDYTRFEEHYGAETFMIWGGADPVLRSELGNQLLQRLPNTELEILDGVGHLPQEEAPEKVGALLATFLLKKRAPKKNIEPESRLELLSPAPELKRIRKKTVKPTVVPTPKPVTNESQVSVGAAAMSTPEHTAGTGTDNPQTEELEPVVPAETLQGVPEDSLPENGSDAAPPDPMSEPSGEIENPQAGEPDSEPESEAVQESQ